MSLRTRLVLAFVLLTTLATLAVGAGSYVATVDRLVAEIDRSLADIARILTDQGLDGDGPGGQGPADPGGPPGADVFVTQVLDVTGAATASDAGPALPVEQADRAIATGTDRAATLHRDVVVDGVRYRLLTAAVPASAGAVQVARRLAEEDRVAASLREGIIAAVIVVVLLSTAAGWLLARQLTGRLVRMAHAADEVATTGRLEVPVPIEGRDEIATLGVAFNRMLGSLQRSREAQQRLVADAGHELRTPLTSLRTNISVLRRHPELDSASRDRLLDDLESESRELTTLANELVDLAADRRDDGPIEEVALGPLVEHAAERARRRTGRDIHVTTDGSRVEGRPAALGRAITNLLDNAAKFDPSGSPIDVDVREGRVAVSDRGPGIAAEDRPFVFDRFFRSADARGRPGSGLGLAIVRDIAEAHGGSVFVDGRPDGGTTVGFVLPARTA
jgi:two-component system, OmpR family, sensor histidine kinase MprB